MHVRSTQNTLLFGILIEEFLSSFHGPPVFWGVILKRIWRCFGDTLAGNLDGFFYENNEKL